MFNTLKSGMSNTYCMGIVAEVAVEVNIIRLKEIEIGRASCRERV